MGAHRITFHVWLAVGHSGGGTRSPGLGRYRLSRRLCLLPGSHGVGNWNLGAQAKRYLDKDAPYSALGRVRFPDLASQLHPEHHTVARHRLFDSGGPICARGSATRHARSRANLSIRLARQLVSRFERWHVAAFSCTPRLPSFTGKNRRFRMTEIFVSTSWP